MKNKNILKILRKIDHLLQYKKKWQCFVVIDKVKTTQKANIIYDILLAKNIYIGKTDQCFVTHLDEHGSVGTLVDHVDFHVHILVCLCGLVK